MLHRTPDELKSMKKTLTANAGLGFSCLKRLRTDYERSLESTYGPAPPPYDYVPTVSASVNNSDPPPGQRPSYCYDVTTRDSATLMDNELPPAYNEIFNVTPQNDPRGELTDDLRDDLRGDLTDDLRDDPWVKEEESPDEVTV